MLHASLPDDHMLQFQILSTVYTVYTHSVICTAAKDTRSIPRVPMQCTNTVLGG